MRYGLVVGLLAVTVGCGGAARAPLASSAWSYELHAAGPANQMALDVCFPGTPPDALVAPWNGAALRVLSAHGPRGALRVAPGRVELAGLGPGACATLDLDVRPRDDVPGWPRGTIPLAEDARMVPTPAWLWRPEAFVDAPDVQLRVRMPEGEDVALPFPCTAGEGGADCRIDPTTFAWDGLGAFGALERRELTIAGATIEVVRPAAVTRPDWATVETWMRSSGDAVGALLGTFPVSHLLVILAPVEMGGGDPVYYGYTTRGGGAAILFVMRGDATAAELAPEWVSVHEMSHLALPVVPDADAWLSEGFATYYQEVLRTRAGTKTVDDALFAFADGCDRGDGETLGRGLAEESHAVHTSHRWARVYWGGAATFLALDLALRDEGTTLDERMRVLAQRTRAQPRGWNAARVVAALDDGLPHPVAGPLVERLLREPRCPLAPSFAALGVTRDAQGRVLLGGDAATVARRDALLRAAPR